jgi:hypothetical protein
MSEQDEYQELQEHTIRARGMIVERDARGRITSAYVPNPFIIDQLLEHGVIDREQHWHAEQLVAMRMVFLRPVATLKTVTTYQSDSDGRPPAKYPIADNDYLIVLRDMRHDWQKQIVQIAVEAEFNLAVFEKLAFDPDPEAQERKRNHVSNAFWSMTYAINRLLEAKQAAMEAEERKKVLARGENPCDSRFD